MSVTIRPPQPRVQARQTIGRTLIAHGYHETITFSFLPPDQAEPFQDDHDLVRVNEEQKKAEPALRPSVLPSLLACRKANQDAGNRDVRLFEVAQTFSTSKGKYHESRRLALLADAERPADALREMRGTIEELLSALGLEERVRIIHTEDPPAWADPAARIVDADAPERIIGTYGPATRQIAKRFDLQTPAVLAELDYDALIAAYPPQPSVQPLPRFPAIERDLSIVVDEATSWSSIEAAVHGAEPALLEGVEFVVVYRGKPIEKGRKSVTLRMIFRDPNRTLRHEEVSEQVDAVVRRLESEVDAELRAT